MKKSTLLNLILAVLALSFNTAFAPADHGVYAQLFPGNDNKLVIQMVPDKTYSHVVAYVNFYSKGNKRVAQKAFRLSDDDDKYVRKDQCTNRVFKFSFDETVTRVKIDHVNEGEVLNEKGEGTAQGTKIDLPISNKALGPIEK
jgi:hypothetical protein